MNWTERLAKVWNLGNAKLQTRNCGLCFAVCGLRDVKGLYQESRLRQTANVGFKLRISQSRK